MKLPNPRAIVGRVLSSTFFWTNLVALIIVHLIIDTARGEAFIWERVFLKSVFVAFAVSAFVGDPREDRTEG